MTFAELKDIFKYHNLEVNLISKRTDLMCFHCTKKLSIKDEFLVCENNHEYSKMEYLELFNDIYSEAIKNFKIDKIICEDENIEMLEVMDNSSGSGVGCSGSSGSLLVDDGNNKLAIDVIFNFRKKKCT